MLVPKGRIYLLSIPTRFLRKPLKESQVSPRRDGSGGCAKRIWVAPPGWDAKAGTHIKTRVHKYKMGIKVGPLGHWMGLSKGRGGRRER